MDKVWLLVLLQIGLTIVGVAVEPTIGPWVLGAAAVVGLVAAVAAVVAPAVRPSETVAD